MDYNSHDAHHEGWTTKLTASMELTKPTYEHVACRANDIKQKRLLEGNPAKKKSDLLSFSLSFIFRILL